MDKKLHRHIFTLAGRPVIRRGTRSYIFRDDSAAALDELNKIIEHVGRLADLCDPFAESEIESACGINLPNLFCQLTDLRDSEFSDCVNWETIARALRGSEEAERNGLADSLEKGAKQDAVYF